MLINNLKVIEMNWLLILVIIVLGGYAVYGRYRGFIKTVFTLFSTIIALMLTMWLSPIVSKEVQKNDKVMSFVTEKVAKVVKSSNAKKKLKDNTKSKQIDYINHLPFPKAVKKALIENNNSDVYTAMAVDNFKDYISNSIARIIVNAAVFTVLMLISIIGLGVLCEVLNIISKLPVVNGLNKTAGLFVGLLQGFIIIWIGCIVLTTFSGTKTGQDIFDIINQNQFLSMIYNNNYFLKFITNLGTTLF